MSFLRVFDPDQQLKEVEFNDSTQVCECNQKAQSQCTIKATQRMSERIVQVIPGENSTERLVLVHAKQADGSVLLLRQQSYAEGLGWFTQCSVEITESQVSSLLLSLQAAPRVSASKFLGVNATTLRIVS